MRRTAVVLAAAAVLSACGSGPSEPTSAAPSDLRDRCEAETPKYGDGSQLIAVSEDDGDALCWIDGQVAKGRPPGPNGETQPSFNRVVVGVSPDGEATTVKAGYRSTLEPPPDTRR